MQFIRTFEGYNNYDTAQFWKDFRNATMHKISDLNLTGRSTLYNLINIKKVSGNVSTASVKSLPEDQVALENILNGEININFSLRAHKKISDTDDNIFAIATVEEVKEKLNQLKEFVEEQLEGFDVVVNEVNIDKKDFYHYVINYNLIATAQDWIKRGNKSGLLGIKKFEEFTINDIDPNFNKEDFIKEFWEDVYGWLALYVTNPEATSPKDLLLDPRGYLELYVAPSATLDLIYPKSPGHLDTFISNYIYNHGLDDDTMDTNVTSDKLKTICLNEFADVIKKAIEEEPAIYSRYKELINKIVPDRLLPKDLIRQDRSGLWGMKTERKEIISYEYEVGDIVLFQKPDDKLYPTQNYRKFLCKIEKVVKYPTMNSYSVKLKKMFNGKYIQFFEDRNILAYVNPDDEDSVVKFISEYPEFIDELKNFLSEEQIEKYSYIFRSKRSGLIGLKTESKRNLELEWAIEYVVNDATWVDEEEDRNISENCPFATEIALMHQADYKEELYYSACDFWNKEVKQIMKDVNEAEFELTYNEMLEKAPMKIVRQILEEPSLYDKWKDFIAEESVLDNIPDWIKRGSKSSLWGMKTESFKSFETMKEKVRKEVNKFSWNRYIYAKFTKFDNTEELGKLEKMSYFQKLLFYIESAKTVHDIKKTNSIYIASVPSGMSKENFKKVLIELVKEAIEDEDNLNMYIHNLKADHSKGFGYVLPNWLVNSKELAHLKRGNKSGLLGMKAESASNPDLRKLSKYVRCIKSLKSKKLYKGEIYEVDMMWGDPQGAVEKYGINDYMPIECITGLQIKGIEGTNFGFSDYPSSFKLLKFFDYFELLDEKEVLEIDRADKSGLLSVKTFEEFINDGRLEVGDYVIFEVYFNNKDLEKYINTHIGKLVYKSSDLSDFPLCVKFDSLTDEELHMFSQVGCHNLDRENRTVEFNFEHDEVKYFSSDKEDLTTYLRAGKSGLLGMKTEGSNFDNYNYVREVESGIDDLYKIIKKRNSELLKHWCEANQDVDLGNYNARQSLSILWGILYLTTVKLFKENDLESIDYLKSIGGTFNPVVGARLFKEYLEYVTKGEYRSWKPLSSDELAACNFPDSMFKYFIDEEPANIKWVTDYMTDEQKKRFKNELRTKTVSFWDFKNKQSND